jgi:hypothetical protein
MVYVVHTYTVLEVPTGGQTNTRNHYFSVKLGFCGSMNFLNTFRLKILQLHTIKLRCIKIWNLKILYIFFPNFNLKPIRFELLRIKSWLLEQRDFENSFKISKVKIIHILSLGIHFKILKFSSKISEFGLILFLLDKLKAAFWNKQFLFVISKNCSKILENS